MTITAVRSGKTAPYWTKDCYNEKLTNVADQILFAVSMPSKGGGVTEVQLQVTSESFAAVAESMLIANMDAAARAFVSVGYWELIVQAMIDHDEKGAIRTVGQLLRNNKDPAVGACGTILLDKVGETPPLDPKTEYEIVAFTGDGRVHPQEPRLVTFGDIYRASGEHRSAVARHDRTFFVFDLYHAELSAERGGVVAKAWWTFLGKEQAIAHALCF
jgi:hypothetical protein